MSEVKINYATVSTAKQGLCPYPVTPALLDARGVVEVVNILIASPWAVVPLMGADPQPAGRSNISVLPCSTSITARLSVLAQQFGDDPGPDTVEPVEQLLSGYRSRLGSR